MKQVTTLGIDLAKNSFSLYGVDAQGQCALRKTVSRAKLLASVAALPPCLIGMEACSGSHDWARQFQAFGHTVRLMAPKFVTPYRKSGKNDGNDAEAICEAVGRPNMRFVPVKSVEAQAVLALHRIRQGYVEERTAVINRLRAVLAELGKVLPLGTQAVREQASAAAECLPAMLRLSFEQMLAHLRVLDHYIVELDRQFEVMAKQSEPAQRLMGIPGIGPLIALAMVAAVGNAREFNNARQFAAWLGLVPRQYSTGGKARLGRITKCGDRYLRTLLVLGARTVQLTVGRCAHRRSLRVSRTCVPQSPSTFYTPHSFIE